MLGFVVWKKENRTDMTIQRSSLSMSLLMLAVLVTSSFGLRSGSSSSLQGLVNTPLDMTKGETCPKECSCSANFTSVSCIRRKLLRVPRGIPSSVVTLYLGHNLISKIEKGSFDNLTSLKQLYMNDNKISFVDESVFTGLVSLKLLSFSTNKLTDLKVEALQGLSGVEKLYLTRNSFKEVPDFAAAHMENLSSLTLDNNNLECFDLCKREDVIFNKLSNLVLSNNRLQSLEPKNFACINNKSLVKINLSRNRIATIAEDTFLPFNQLQSVILSYNDHFSWNTLMNLTASIIRSHNLASLDLSGVFIREDLILNSTTFSHLSKTNLRYLLLSHSANILIIERDTFSHFPKLEILDLSHGEFSNIKDDMKKLIKLKDLRLHQNDNLKMSFIEQLYLPNLEILNIWKTNIKELKNNFFRGFPRLESLIMMGCQTNKIHAEAFNGLANLKKIDMSQNEIGGSNLPSKLFPGCPNLNEINLRNNKMTTISTQYTLFEGLFQLKKLNLSGNNCYNLSEGLFRDQVSLQVLDLSNNKLGSYFSAAQSNPKLFRTLSSLLALDLHENGISSLPKNLFDGMNSTRSIDLSNNQLASITPALYIKTTMLELVDLSRNHLIQLTPEDVLSLPSKTRLNLTSNPFDCSCDLRPFMYWLKQQNSSYTEKKLANIKSYRCSSPISMANHHFLEFDPNSIIAFCNWVYIMIGSLLALFIVVSTSGMLIFHYRWNIRFRWFLFKQWRENKSKKHHGTTYGSIPPTDDKYEITISYHPHDQQWVLNELIPRLEQWKRGNHNIEKLDDHGDDTEPTSGFLFAVDYNSSFGGPQFFELCKAMTVSERIVHCISRYYLKSERHKQEINTAIYTRHDLDLSIQGGKGLFLILLEANVDLTLPEHIRPLRASNRFCEWSDSSERQTLFWLDLQRELIPNQSN